MECSHSESYQLHLCFLCKDVKIFALKNIYEFDYLLTLKVISSYYQNIIACDNSGITAQVIQHLSN